MKTIPAGFVKMKLRLMFKKEQVDIIENQLLKMLVRDFYIFYTKKDGIQDWVYFYFYCKPDDETSIAYNLGIYAQTMLDFREKKDIKYAGHSVPTGFPGCIHIDREVEIDREIEG